MSQKLLQAVAQNTRLRLINLLKRTRGLGVQEIADALQMSYMGVKEVCQDLEQRGLLESRREPKPAGTTGRPRLVYRLTGRTQEMFPVVSNALTLDLLEAAMKLYGAAAAEKLLLMVWQQKTTHLAGQMKGDSLRERAITLARLRDTEGHMSVLEEGVNLKILEYHCPFADLLQSYPLIRKLDTDLVQRLLGVPVRREENLFDGVMRVEFCIQGE